jgi:hypothetical protein
MGTDSPKKQRNSASWSNRRFQAYSFPDGHNLPATRKPEASKNG